MKKLLLIVFLTQIFNISFSQTILQPAGMKYDMAVLKATWQNIHPALYRFNTQQEIEKFFSKLDLQINKPITLRRFYILISQLNIKLHCGHSYVNYYNNKKIKNELYSKYVLPVMFKVIDNKFIITNNLSDNTELKLGTEIVAINGIPTKTIIDSLLTVSKADGKNGLNKQLDNITIYKRDINESKYCLFDIFYPLFFKSNINDSIYTLTIKNKKQLKIITLYGLLKDQRERAYIFKYGDIPKNEQSWSIKEVDSKTVFFRLGDFATYNWKFDFKKYLDSTFIVINKKDYTNLIIDIRENEGGVDEARDAVLSYLTERNIGCANPVRRLYKYITIPDTLKQNLDTWDDTFKKDKIGYKLTKDGYYELEKPTLTCDTILPNKNHFKGQLFLITDATNSSATFIMADCIKRNKLGILVGETTGGTQQGINGGEIFFFSLPKSKIEMDIPLIWQKPLGNKPDEGIKPDYEIYTTRRDLTMQKDPALNFILKKLIK